MMMHELIDLLFPPQECYSEALKEADAKKQKVILRVIKRLISTEKSHATMLKVHGALLLKTIQGLAHTAR